jgi:hypothetical protein
MLWIYYSTQIFLLGAEFTFAHASARDPRLCEQAQKAAARATAAAQRSGPPESAPRGGEMRAIAAGQRAEGQPHWLRRLWSASAAGLVAGLTVARFVRSHSAKVR